MSFWNKVFWGILIGIILLGIIGWSWTIIEWDNQSRECAEKYGGKVVRGYCTYIKGGDSTSFSIWEEEVGKHEDAGIK